MSQKVKQQVNITSNEERKMPGKQYEIAAQNTLTLLQKHSLFKI